MATAVATTTARRSGGSSRRTYWGVDVSTPALHAVAIDDAGVVVDHLVVAPGDLDHLTDEMVAAGAHVAAVDAPSGWSEGLHAGDADLPRKFTTARCGEVALRGQHGYAVPWPTPAEPGERTGWMEVGIAVHERLAPLVRTEETFPHAAFLLLAGERRLPRKSSPAGRARRAALLADRLAVDARELATWSADAVDALVAALTARDTAGGRSTIAACQAHPTSTAIHLPAAARSEPPRS